MPAILDIPAVPQARFDAVARHDPMHRYFAGHGYACLRVDMRGSGDSDGLMTDEYRRRSSTTASGDRVDRGAALVHRQGRHDRQLLGRVQRAPDRGAPAAGARGDRHVLLDRRPLRRRHALHGRMRSSPTPSTGARRSSRCLRRPPDPRDRRATDWRRKWQERLERLDFPLADWLRHQRRDAFWKHGSVNEDYSAIQCPVFAVGGWIDGYSNAIPRLLAQPPGAAAGARSAPWAHEYRPPRPSRDRRSATCRSASAGSTTGSRARTPGSCASRCCARSCRRGCRRPATIPICPGRWVAEPEWPSPRIRRQRLHLNAGGTLRARAGRAATLTPPVGPQLIGVGGGEWCPYGIGGYGPQFPGDQREDDVRALVVRDRAAAPAARDPRARRRWSWRSRWTGRRRSSPSGSYDVFPDGASTRVSYGVLNLAHRTSHEALRRCRSGKRDHGPRPAERRRVLVHGPATGFAWPSRPPTGRWSGPRPSP